MWYGNILNNIQAERIFEEYSVSNLILLKQQIIIKFSQNSLEVINARKFLVNSCLQFLAG